MPIRRSISFRKFMRKISKSTEDLSLLGRYRSTEDLSSGTKFIQEEEDDRPVKFPGPSEKDILEVYQRHHALTPGGFLGGDVDGWKEEQSKEFDDEKLLEQYAELGDVLIEKGELRLDFQRASDVKDCLENFAQFTGGRDRKGYLYITILNEATEEDVKLGDLKKVVLYLTTHRSISDADKQNGFSFLVSLKQTSPFGTFKPLSKVLQESFPYNVAHIYAIKPQGYRERLMSSTSKSKFDLNLIAKENLFKYIAPEELTPDFGGLKAYNHTAWFNMRLAFEKFLFESMALSSKLEDIKRSLLQDDFAVTVDGVREQLHHHQHVRKWIVKAPIELLDNEAEKVINIIKTSCDCMSEDDLKDEYKNSMIQVRGMIGTLKEQRQMLKELWVSRKGQLEQRFQFNVFKQDTEKMLDWIQDNRDEFLCHFTEIGDDLDYAQELREEHKQFEENCGDVQVNIDRILKVAERLKDMQFFDVELIDRLYIKLDNEWMKLYSAVERRTIMLEASILFHSKSEEYLLQCKLWIEEILSLEKRPITSQTLVDELLKTHEELKNTMKESYDAVSAEAKALLSVLQRSPTGDAPDSREEKARSRLSDYTEGASHVMDVIVDLYEQNKQLSIMWEKQKIKINQKYKLSLFDIEMTKILKKLKGSGSGFLSKNPWVGDCLELAEEILTDQDEFEKSFHDTYIKSKKLIESAAQLAESKECDPQEIKAKATYLETEVKTFTAKLKKRRELLKMAVNFYKNSQKLSKSTDKLKDDLHLEAGGVEPQNFDQHLEKHRNECESTLEKLLATVQDGQTLSSELLQEVKVPEKDSRTSFFSHGSNSVEHSRQAVETHLKELNHNRAQLEKLWRGRQQKLDYWVKVKHYERDTNTLYLDVSKWNCSWQKKELSSDVNKAINLVHRFEEEYKDLAERFNALLEEGKQLEELLQSCGVEVLITINEAKVDSRRHVAKIMKQSHSEFSVIKKIHHNLKIKYDFSIKQRKLEADAKKVAGWIRHGESILQASQEAGFSMFEAEALLREYERFHNAIETTRLGVVDIKLNSDKLKDDGHPDHITIMNISENVEKKWKQLMTHAEERRAVVFSSYNFYRAAEQIGKLLDKFSKDCRSEEDPCAVFNSYELKFRREKIEALIKQSEPERKAVEDGCLKVKDSAQEFLKHVLPSGDGNTTPVIEGTVGRLEITVQDLVEQVTSQEAFVLKQIQLRKNVLANCAEYVTFEESVQETLKLIQEQGTVVSDGFKSLQTEKEAGQKEAGQENGDEAAPAVGGEQDEEQNKLHLQKEEEYRSMFLQIRERVKKLLNEASDFVAKMHFHRVAISELATSIDTRYKDLAQVMKQYRESLESKLQTTLPEFEDEEEWPSLSVFEISSTELSVARRDVSHDSGIHEMTEEKRRSVKRIEFIIKELIQTERTYVDDLKCCIDNFLAPMYNSPDLPDALHGASDIIFGNIEHIHEFHSKVFLRELEKYEKCAENVGKCFIEWAEKFHMYVDFCANKPDSNSLLIEHGETFFEDLQYKNNLGLSLAAYLIKPVQRITKYQLLLKDLLSCCDDADGSLQAGLDVMLSVPRRANDAMYLCLIKGFDEQGSLETLGKILLQDSFIIFDPKHILKKGKERHVFLFEQALLLCKEIKDVNGKCCFEFKTKLKTSELGITEHMAEDKCKFAVWTGNPPYTEEKRIIKAESEEVKHMWVKEIRGLTQQFQFGLLQARASFYPTSPRKRGNRKSTSQADISFTSETSNFNIDRASGEYDTATICSRSSLDNTSIIVTDRYIVTEDFTPKGESEIAVTRGQTVEILGRPPGSRSWRLRIMDSDVTGENEGLVPFQYLKKIEESPLRNKRMSSETLHSQSSEDSFATDSPKGSSMSITGESTSKSGRRRTKSNINMNALKMRTWSKGTAKKYAQQMAAMQKPPLPSTPSRRGTMSGGGSKKLQALLGAPESDIDLLIRPSDGKYATLGRSPGNNAERVKFLHANEPEDAGFQEGDYDSEGDSMSDSNESYSSSVKGDSEERAVTKRMIVLQELIRSENDYINDIEVIVLKYMPAVIQRNDLPEELKEKEKIIFGNLSDILTFHKGTLIKELKECESAPEKLATTFLQSEKKFELYIQYCANKPRSAALVHDFLTDFFDDVTNTLQLKTSLTEYLMKPVQRIMKYHTILKDFIKYTARAGLNTDELLKALHIMQSIPKKSDDVMNIGMLEGYTGNLNDQGKLLIQDTLFVANAKLQEPSAERRVFLFEKMVIFCEPFERKTDLKAYLFRHSVETQTLGLTSNYDDDPCKLAIWSKKENGSSEIYVMAAGNAVAKKNWIEAIRRILEEQHGMGTNVNSRLGAPKAVLKALKSYRKVSRQSIGSNSSYNSDGAYCNGRKASTDKMVRATCYDTTLLVYKFYKLKHLHKYHHHHHANRKDARFQAMVEYSVVRCKGKIIPSLQHVNLVPLDQLKAKNKSDEDLSKPTIEHKRYMVTDNYQANSAEELTVHKGEIVYLVHRDKKSATFYKVRSFTKEREGQVPSKFLQKSKDKNNDDQDKKVKRSNSIGNGEKKEKKDKSKKSKVNSGTLLRTASLKRKKKEKEKLNGDVAASKPVLETLHHHWQSNFDSSDEDGKEANAKASESLNKIIHRDPKTTFEVAPEFKILPRDVTVEVATHVKLTCTVLSNPLPNVTWTKNDSIELKTGDKYKIDFKNSMCTFEILSTEAADTGTYTVTATNKLGSASYSAKITVRGESKPGVPSKPYFTSVTSSSLDIRWSAPCDVDLCPVSGYTVQYQAVGGTSWQMAVAACHTTHTTVENLVTGTSYRFLITAHNAKGESIEGEPSDPVTIGNSESPRHNVHEIKWREKIENSYQICGELGRGRFSIVKRCVEKTTNKEYAAKIVRRRMVSKENVESEVAILQALNHPAIVSLHEIYDAPNGLVLVEQLLAGGRLFDHIVIMDNLTEQIAIRYIKELLLALSYLHKNNIAHLDVKPENILLTGGESPSVVVSDFGDAVRLSKRVPYQHELSGNPEFAAPEIVSGDTVSLATDMWSVGVVVFVLLGGVSPFYSDNRERACANVTEIRYTFPEDFFSEVSDEAKDFIEELLVRDQSSRPEADECLNFSWIKMSDPPKTTIELSRLAAFNARRRYQYESNNTSTLTSHQLLSSPQKKTSTTR